ncbi:MAG: ribonuclease P protein component [Anaerolineaceae bacterium]|nr:ribonuclease P protein component [Anaerolineaceae bacterium]
MKRSFRLTSSTDFKRVRRTGKSYAHPLIVLQVSAGDHPGVRIGIAAGKTVGGAVQRNRAKRLLRAGLEPYLAQFRSGWDVVFIARAPIGQANFSQVQAAIQTLLERAHLVENLYVT